MQDTGSIMRDIHGLDAISWWPLAAGWWWLIGLFSLCVAVALVRYWVRYSGIMPGWRGDARRQLRDLRKAVRREDPRDVAGRLSILLRRIAMARSDRRQAAGLSGDDWLAWLEQDDSNGFRWTRDGRVLLQAPYMPPEMTVKRGEVLRLVVAARRWVDTTPTAATAAGAHWFGKIRVPRLRRTGGASNV